LIKIILFVIFVLFVDFVLFIIRLGSRQHLQSVATASRRLRKLCEAPGPETHRWRLEGVSSVAGLPSAGAAWSPRWLVLDQKEIA
jgi:hypothetical protein